MKTFTSFMTGLEQTGCYRHPYRGRAADPAGPPQTVHFAPQRPLSRLKGATITRASDLPNVENIQSSMLDRSVSTDICPLPGGGHEFL